MGEEQITAQPTGLSDSQTDPLLPSQQTRHDPIHQRLLAVLQNRRTPYPIPTDQIPDEPTAASTRDLVRDQHLVKQVPLLRRHALDPSVGQVRRELPTQQARQVTSIAHGLVDVIRHLLCLVPVGDVGHDLVFDPLADFGAEGGVGLVEVRGVILEFEKDRVSKEGSKTSPLDFEIVRV